MSLNDDTEEITSYLQKIGLDNREERVCYVALRYLGSATAEEITRKAVRLQMRMTKPRAYAALKRLHDKRIIQKTSAKPAVYVFPQDPLPSLDSWARKTLRNSEKRVDDGIAQIAAFLEKEKHRPPSIMGLINVIGVGPEKKLETATTLRTRRLFQRADSRIDIMTSRFHWVSRIESDLRNVLDKEVTMVRVLLLEANLRKKTTYGSILRKLAREYANQFQLFNYNPGSLRLSMIDYREAIVVIRSTKRRDIAAFHVDNEEFVKEILVPAFLSHHAKAKRITVSNEAG